ncbi:type II toxin-antitoxin system PemI/MazE family antitoxin [Limosilactobacillus ingluviei]|uniref:type II toxin-antitoxin system PemI/MazE family antitoxin n=1 Tax=Limosilactobacillus ingluviei TaxID=148604 RepID=UPI0009EAACA7|nr:AbrB family transcriptional regulator [Limosilactobacillus ingluviei]
MTIKVRKVGNSVTLTIPKPFNISVGAQFKAKLQDDGSIVYRPEHRNPFEGNWFREDLHQKDVMNEREVLDSEWS